MLFDTGGGGGGGEVNVDHHLSVDEEIKHLQWWKWNTDHCHVYGGLGEEVPFSQFTSGPSNTAQ